MTARESESVSDPQSVDPDRPRHDPEPPNAARVLAVEIAVAHLQHDFEQLHRVALDLQQELRLAQAAIVRLENRLEEASAEPEARDPLAERPPHY